MGYLYGMYQEICTNDRHAFVEAGWSYYSGPVTQNNDILPDNCFDVLLDLSSGASYISGVMSGVAARKTPENRHILGLRIKAEYLSMFTKTPARLQFATRRLQQAPSKSLLHIAFESGYYDHAHMTKDFKKTTGKAPSSFR